MKIFLYCFLSVILTFPMVCAAALRDYNVGNVKLESYYLDVGYSSCVGWRPSTANIRNILKDSVEISGSRAHDLDSAPCRISGNLLDSQSHTTTFFSINAWGVVALTSATKSGVEITRWKYCSRSCKMLFAGVNGNPNW